MRITCFANGLRGDIGPTVALAWQLSQRDHDVTVAVPGEFRGFAEQAGLRTFPLPFNLMAWLRTPEGQRLLQAGGVSILRATARQYSRYAEEMDEAFQRAAQGAEALVGELITIDRVQALGDSLQVPVAMVSQIPVAPSGEYPSVTLARRSLRFAALNRASSRFSYWAWRQGGAKALRSFRGKLGLPERSHPPIYRLFDHGAPILHTFSRSLLPRPTDWPDNLKLTGAWKMPPALRESVGEGLPGELETWIEAGDTPLFLGFGSMPVLNPDSLLDDIAGATAALGLRAIVSENCVSARAAGTLPDHLYAAGPLDHDRLFARCAAVVHHGGIGSTLASLRAGRPTMVNSVFGDQPWCGERVRALGAGTHVPFRKLNRSTLESGLRTLVDPGVQRRARALGAAIQAEGDGLPAAAQLLEDWLVTAEPTPLDSEPGIRAPSWLDHIGVEDDPVGRR